MKKIIFGLIATVLFTIMLFGQTNINLINIEGSEIAFIKNIRKDNTFSDYYILQYDNIDFTNLLKLKNLVLVDENPNSITLKCDSDTYLFTNKSITNIKNQFQGYGLSNRKGIFKLIPIDSPTSLNQIISSNGKLDPNRGLECLSGGVGSTGCTVTPSNLNPGTASCSLTCGSGYHSCCNDVVGECRCVANPKPVKLQ